MPDTEESRINDALHASDEAAILEMLDAGLSPHRLDESGRTLLHLAAMHRMPDLAAELIRRGAAADPRDFHDRTPLMLAAHSGAHEVMDHLLQAGADPGWQNAWGRTALMYAAHGLHLGALERLLGAGATPHAVDRDGGTAAGYLRLREKTSDRKECQEALKLALTVTPAPEGSRTEGPGREAKGSRWNPRDVKSGRPEDEAQVIGLRGAIGCAAFALFAGVLIGSFKADWTLMVQVAVALVLLGIWGNLIIPSLQIYLRKSQLPEPKETLPPDTATSPVPTTADSPEYVSTLLLLGSRAIAGASRNAPRDPGPGFDHRMRVTRVRSIGVGLLATGIIIATPYLIDWSNPLLLVVVFLTVAGMSMLEGVNRSRRAAELQALEDACAQRLSERLNEELERPSAPPADYGLYLRGFHTTGRLEVKGVDLETQIAHSINSILPIVALGRPGEHLGAGRIAVPDEDWQEEVLRLMHDARIILLVPSEHAGTMWEIDQLRERAYLDRTIFIMPPELRLEGEPISAEWNRAAEALREGGFEIPRHFRKGLFFSVDGTGQFRDHAPFTMDEFFDESIRRTEDSRDDWDDLEDVDPLDGAAAVALLGDGFNDTLDDDGDNGDGDGGGGNGDGGD